MKKLIFLITSTLLILNSCSSDKIKGNKEITSEVYEISHYNKIKINGDFELIYEQKLGKPYLKIETDSNIFDYIDVENKGSELILELDNNGSPSSLIVYTNSTDLEGINISGASKVHLKDSIIAEKMHISSSGSGKLHIDNLNTESFKVENSGSTSLNVAKIKSNTISIKGSGSTNVELDGETNDAEFAISGSGEIFAADLEAKTVNCAISGSGKMTVSCSEKLDISVSGSGTIEYYGDPKVNQKISGSGKVIKK